ncbi:MAG: TRAP transporter substrate-binding protein DctP, partial [Rhodospirillales bacterium]|nr:TRAP transporter substrate-binding protein DctP [Rhodospirillales bacterium]
VKPIHTLADFKGRKLRVFGSKFEIETLRRVGATGVPMPLSEVIPAIQQRTIDGNKAAMVVFVPFKYQTIARYVLKAKSSIICINKMASKVWFDKLPRDVQTVIMEESAKADKFIIDWSEALTKKLYQI